jgi:signal transduction histidine kinase
MNKGSIYKMQDNHPEAIKEYLKSLQLFEKEGHDQGRGMALGNIAHVYLQLRNFKQAEKYLKQSEDLAIKSNNKESLGSVAIALTNIYQETDMPKAIDYAKLAVDIYNQLGNKYSEAVALSVLGRCYQETGDYKQAELFTERGLALAKEVNYPNLLAQLLINLSNVRYYQGNYQESDQLASEARKLDSSNIEIKHNVLYNHIRNNMYLGNLKTVEDYIDEYSESIQQFATDGYQESISDLEVKYETEKKELQITALEKQRQLYIWLGITIGGILLIALAFAFLRYRLAVNKRKLAEQESRRLEQEKQLVAVQATLDGEAAERTRLAKDLHDGLGGMLSAVKLNLPQVNGDALLEAMDVTRFQTALGMLDDSIQELRRVAHHMMPESLLRYGLKVSLADFCAAIPTADFHYFGDEGRLPSKMEIMVYRCIHELVNNALKHADANHINVQLVQESNRVSFTVQDNGKGFDQQTTSEGMGLRNIRQRVEAFQGEMDVLSSSQGTEIHVELELKKNKSYD